jgi:hypothetical protein
MKIRQSILRADNSVTVPLAECAAIEPQLVLAFGAADQFRHADFFTALKQAFPRAALAGCSTAGEISAEGVADGSVVITAIHFARPQFRVASTTFAGLDDSHAAGARIGQQLNSTGLHDALVFAQGVEMNGSALIEGFQSAVAPGVKLSGGLAGDGGAFKETYVLTSEGVFADRIVAVGFYGAVVHFGHGSFGGWRPFGPKRRVTRAAGNILYELDGQPALEVYKKYLGEYAKDLPASGLLFPFSMLREDSSSVGLIRTILGIDESAGSLVLAGDVLENGYLQLMHASTDALVDGAHAAAQAARDVMADEQASLAILVSCVGRKMVMGARVDEEVEAVGEVLGKSSTIAGFYSYGEISPFFSSPECKLHNQTMTITYLREAA